MSRLTIVLRRSAAVAFVATFVIGTGLPLAAQAVSAQAPFVVRHFLPGGSALWSITAGTAGLVTVGVGGTILSSTDGANWTTRNSGTNNWLVGVTYGGGQYLAVGDNGTVLASEDAATWAHVGQSATANRLNNVVYAAGIYVAVGEGGAIITSPDGLNWTARSSGVTGWLRGLAYVNGFDYNTGSAPSEPESQPARFIAAGEGGSVLGSTDGITWSQVFPGNGSGGDLEAVTGTGHSDFTDFDFISDFVAVGDSGTASISEWTEFGTAIHLPRETQNIASINTSIQFRGLVRSGENVFATGENGTIEVASLTTSYPGISGWSPVQSGTTADLTGGETIGDSIFVIGDDEAILQYTPSPGSRLINLSCRSQVGIGANAMIAGFVVGGKETSGTIALLIRASGPALAPFDVGGVLPDPELQLYSTAGKSSLLAANTGWGGGSQISNEAVEVGAFPWANPSSLDSALIESLPIGAFTANITGASGDTGIALAEIYDATAPSAVSIASPRLVNLSARSNVGTAGGILIAGFVIDGQIPKTVLVRASGPALVPFGISGTIPDPTLQIFSTSSGTTLLASNTGWGGDAQIAAAAAWEGAFSWGVMATKDSAVLVTLPPGSYTADVSGASGDTGIALVEVYEVQ